MKLGLLDSSKILNYLTFFDFLLPFTPEFCKSFAKSTGFGGGLAGGILLKISREFSKIGDKLNCILYSFFILNASFNPPNVNLNMKISVKIAHKWASSSQLTDQ